MSYSCVREARGARFMATGSNGNRLKYSKLDDDMPQHRQNVLPQLYERTSPVVRAVLRKILDSNQEAEDVLDSTFLLAAERVKLDRSGGGDEGPTLNPWLLLTARSQAIQRLRAAKNQSQSESPAIPGEELPVQAQEIRLLESRRDVLRRLTEQLPAGQRRLLDLVVFGGQTEEEIARATNEPLGKVRDEVRAAFAFVRQRVQTVMGTWTAGL